MSEIKFFGEVDIHPTKKHISSEYPAWYFSKALENLEEDIGRIERQLGRGQVPADKVPIFRERLAQFKERHDKIIESIPKLSDAEKDDLAKSRKELAKIIREGYFSRSSMMKGTADPQKEADRMSKPMVALKPEFVDLMKGCNVRISEDGKVPREGLVKAWKMAGKLLNLHGGDEETNAEILRKD